VLPDRTIMGRLAAACCGSAVVSGPRPGSEVRSTLGCQDR
jgi:hypothetical protein